MTTYTLRTLIDVFDRVPPDRIDLCMSEIAKGMAQAKQLGDLLIEPIGWPDDCEWTDDDDGVISLRLATDNGDELEFLTVSTKT